jgi:tRNA A37 threonylcarbamoyladenosine synthetase subunit TsaC/SUA5/YrdC
LTLVVGGAPEKFFAPGIAGKTGAVGFRCSDHPLAAVLVEAAAERGLGPLTATSFNRSGETAVENAVDAVLLANSSADPRVLVLDARAADAFKQAPSTVVDVSTEAPRVLRDGAIDVESVTVVLDRFRNATQRR